MCAAALLTETIVIVNDACITVVILVLIIVLIGREILLCQPLSPMLCPHLLLAKQYLVLLLIEFQHFFNLFVHDLLFPPPPCRWFTSCSSSCGRRWWLIIVVTRVNNEGTPWTSFSSGGAVLFYI